MRRRRRLVGGGDGEAMRAGPIRGSRSAFGCGAAGVEFGPARSSHVQEDAMKKVMAIYIGTAAGLERAKWNDMDPEKRKAAEAKGIQAWHDWMTKHAASVVDGGGPLGKTKRTSPQGVADGKNDISGYIVVQA